MNKAAPASDPRRADVAAQVEKIAGSELFASAGRLAPFLRYVVQAMLEGRAAELKEATIAVAVFGRAADYDPRTDPIVRVEARRLRSRLADYYSGPGGADPIVIDLPKGAYVPTFTFRECTPAPAVRPLDKRWVGAVAVVVVGLGAWWMVARPQRTAHQTSIAVLPFVNVSADPTNEYFSDGLTDELIDTLGRVPNLRVVGRSLVFQQKDKQYDLQTLARQWSANAVLEGSVRKSGDRLRITAQLTNAADGYNLWSQTYDRQITDVFAIQREIATAIASALRLKLGSPERVRRPETNLTAYNAYLEARYHLNRYTKEGFQLGFRSLEKAIAADPNWEPAYSLGTLAYSMGGYYYVLPPAQAWEKAKAMATRALELDPSSADAHAGMGFVLGLNEWKWADSEREFKRALELDPSSPEAHSGYATACLMPQGRLEQAVAEYRKSIELDPLFLFSRLGAGFSLLALRRYDEALPEYKRALELNSTFGDVWWDNGMCLALMGRKEQARTFFLKAQEVDGGRKDRLGAGPLALLGEHDAAVRELNGWLQSGKVAPEDFIDIARVYGVLGDVPNTVKWLEEAWRVREPQLVWLKVDPRFDKVRSAPEFRAIMRRLGL